jgi:hypothetical protein
MPDRDRHDRDRTLAAMPGALRDERRDDLRDKLHEEASRHLAEDIQARADIATLQAHQNQLHLRAIAAIEKADLHMQLSDQTLLEHHAVLQRIELKIKTHETNDDVRHAQIVKLHNRVLSRREYWTLIFAAATFGVMFVFLLRAYWHDMHAEKRLAALWRSTVVSHAAASEHSHAP